MKRLAAYKWLLVGALVAFLCVGVVACSADGKEAGVHRVMSAATYARASVAVAEGAKTAAADMGPAAARKQARQEKREARVERRVALLEHLRDDMSAADQQQYDQLADAVQEQRAAVKEARQELAATLKALRTLVDKYLDASGAPGN